MDDVSASQAVVDSPPSTPERMRRAFRRLVTGVALVTVRDEQDRPMGMTASAVASVSLEPQSMLVCINRGTHTWDLIRDRRRFGVSVLDEGQRHIAEHGAQPGADKGLDVCWLDPRLASDAPPAIAGALSLLTCAVDRVAEVGTHAIVVPEVQGILLGGDGAPLAYFEGAYRQLDPSPDRRYEAFWELFDRHGY
jgi:flavin reductase (DIM6/NTAB) family NADH-FMN oxidoreductase RutF